MTRGSVLVHEKGSISMGGLHEVRGIQTIVLDITADTFHSCLLDIVARDVLYTGDFLGIPNTSKATRRECLEDTNAVSSVTPFYEVFEGRLK
jgi:hypothetical protein